MEPIPPRTRSGRIIKKPERYTPVEQVEDDFSDSELESHWDSDISSEISYDPEDFEEEESETDLSDFIAEDDDNNNESDDNNGSDDDSSDGETEASSDDAESVASSDPADVPGRG